MGGWKIEFSSDHEGREGKTLMIRGPKTEGNKLRNYGGKKKKFHN